MATAAQRIEKKKEEEGICKLTLLETFLPESAENQFNIFCILMNCQRDKSAVFEERSPGNDVFLSHLVLTDSI